MYCKDSTSGHVAEFGSMCHLVVKTALSPHKFTLAPFWVAAWTEKIQGLPPDLENLEFGLWSGKPGKQIRDLKKLEKGIKTHQKHENLE